MKFKFKYVTGSVDKVEQVNAETLSAECKAGKLLVAYCTAITLALPSVAISKFRALSEGLLDKTCLDLLSQIESNQVQSNDEGAQKSESTLGASPIFLACLKYFVEGISLNRTRDFTNDRSNSVESAMPAEVYAQAVDLNTTIDSKTAKSTVLQYVGTITTRSYKKSFF